MSALLRKLRYKMILSVLTIIIIVTGFLLFGCLNCEETNTASVEETVIEDPIDLLISARKKIPVQYTVHDVRDYYIYNKQLLGTHKSLQLLPPLKDIRKNTISVVKQFDPELPIIYVITPTYTRLVQKAELTNMCTVMKHVRNLLWIVLEDFEKKTDLVIKFLMKCEIPTVHMNFRSKFEPERTIDKRNAALQWIRDNVDTSFGKGVVYFADDDNTYDPDVFEEMRYTKKISVWPIALVSNHVERPIVRDGKVVDWVSGFDVKERVFPMDMAGFALNVRLLHERPNAKFRHDIPDNYLETTFIESLGITQDDLEPKASNCTEVLVWHTRTAPPFPFFAIATKSGDPPDDINFEA